MSRAIRANLWLFSFNGFIWMLHWSTQPWERIIEKTNQLQILNKTYKMAYKSAWEPHRKEKDTT